MLPDCWSYSRFESYDIFTITVRQEFPLRREFARLSFLQEFMTDPAIDDYVHFECKYGNIEHHNIVFLSLIIVANSWLKFFSEFKQADAFDIRGLERI